MPHDQVLNIYFSCLFFHSVLPDYIEKIAQTMVVDPACEVLTKEVRRRRNIFVDDESLVDNN